MRNSIFDSRKKMIEKEAAGAEKQVGRKRWMRWNSRWSHNQFLIMASRIDSVISKVGSSLLCSSLFTLTPPDSTSQCSKHNDEEYENKSTKCSSMSNKDMTAAELAKVMDKFEQVSSNCYGDGRQSCVRRSSKTSMWKTKWWAMQSTMPLLPVHRLKPFKICYVRLRMKIIWIFELSSMHFQRCNIRLRHRPNKKSRHKVVVWLHFDMLRNAHHCRCSLLRSINWFRFNNIRVRCLWVFFF